MSDPADAGGPPRVSPLTVVTLSVLAVAVGAVALAITLYWDLRSDVTTPRENIVWAAYQIQAEHQRLMLSVREVELGRADFETLDQRYQIFVSRVLILRDGEAYRPMRQITGHAEMLARSLRAIAVIDHALQNEITDAAGYAKMIERHLGVLDRGLQEVAVHAVAAVSEKRTAQQIGLLDTMSLLTITLVLVVGASIALAGLTMKQFAALNRSGRSLAAALERAEGSNLAKSRFLAGMSHEMRTPLNAVIGMLREIGYRTSDPAVHELVATAHASADMLCGLVDDVLDTTRIETGKFNFQYSSFDPAGLVEEVASLLSSRAEDRRNEITIDAAALSGRFIVSDRARLKQVLVNLLGNAVKYTQDGNIMIHASFMPGQDDLTMLRISVSDSGIGIASEDRQRIFSRYFQSGHTDGLGLGLSICREIVERLGGRIAVESELGQGSTFWFEVPVSVADMPARPAPHTGSRARLHGQLQGARILVAEDNSTNRRVIRLLLERHGADFDFAHNGEEAVAMAFATTYDVVLMDINMPVMDGLDALARIRRRADTAVPPVLALTASAMPEDLERFQLAGMAGCITKPIDEGELLKRISEVIARPAVATRVQAAAGDARDAAPATRLDDGQRNAVLDLIAAIDDEDGTA